MPSVLEDLGINEFTKIVNEIYDSGEILEDIRSIFIVIRKKQVQINAIDNQLRAT